MKVPRHPFPAKLTLEQAEVIRKRYAAGEAPGQLASEYGIAASSIYAVVHERAHRRRVVVTLSTTHFQQLEHLATAKHASRDEVACELIRRALDMNP